jgi:hypothetical protein
VEAGSVPAFPASNREKQRRKRREARQSGDTVRSLTGVSKSKTGVGKCPEGDGQTAQESAPCI